MQCSCSKIFTGFFHQEVKDQILHPNLFTLNNVAQTYLCLFCLITPLHSSYSSVNSIITNSFAVFMPVVFWCHLNALLLLLRSIFYLLSRCIQNLPSSESFLVPRVFPHSCQVGLGVPPLVFYCTFCPHLSLHSVYDDRIVQGLYLHVSPHLQPHTHVSLVHRTWGWMVTLWYVIPWNTTQQ